MGYNGLQLSGKSKTVAFRHRGEWIMEKFLDSNSKNLPVEEERSI
jgi:hypothetical protein